MTSTTPYHTSVDPPEQSRVIVHSDRMTQDSLYQATKSNWGDIPSSSSESPHDSSYANLDNRREY
jgi:hypothetical protein